MTIASVAGGLAAVPTLIILRRRVPPPPFVMRLMAASAVGMAGSMLGFAAGGTAAAMEVNSKMTDAQR